MAVMYSDCTSLYQCANTCTSSATTSNVIWNSWIGTTTCTSNTIWCNWIITDAVGNQYIQPVQMDAQQAQALAQQHAQQYVAQQQAQAEANQRYAEQQQQREAAYKKSMELLDENLSPTQRAALKKHNWFLVQGGKSGKTYRIRANHHAGNIFELDKKGKDIAKYCVHASYEFALGDQLLTQALSLRLDEDHIIKTANRTPLAA